jgi:hypothetical protein
MQRPCTNFPDFTIDNRKHRYLRELIPSAT